MSFLVPLLWLVLAQESSDAWLSESAASAQVAEREFNALVARHQGSNATSILMAAWDDIVAQWSEFESRVEQVRDEELASGSALYNHDVFDLLYFKTPFRIGLIGKTATPRIREATDDEGFVRLLQEFDAALAESMERHLAGEFDHPRMSHADYESAGYHRAELLHELGRALEGVGRREDAMAVWTTITEAIGAVIESIVARGLDAHDEYDSQVLAQLTTSWLQARRLAEGDSAFTDAAEEAVGWLTHQQRRGPHGGDHSTASLLRFTAEEWLHTRGDQGGYLDLADRLGETVRTMYREIWPEDVAGSNNVEATLVRVTIAVINDDMATAEALLQELEGLQSLPEYARYRVGKFRRLAAARARASAVATAKEILDELERLLGEPSMTAASPPRPTAGPTPAPERSPPRRRTTTEQPDRSPDALAPAGRSATRSALLWIAPVILIVIVVLVRTLGRPRAPT